MKWKPITSAPKDRAILAWAKGWAFPFVLSWHATGRDMDDDLPGWTDYSRNKYEQYANYHPTHWMDIPNPPEQP